MKKIFTLLFLGSLTTLTAQTSIEVRDLSNNMVVPANGIVMLSTSPGNTTSRTFDIKNTSANTNTYVVIRYDALLNSSAVAYYCFAGTCYGNTTFISPNPLVLTAGQSASQYTTQYTTLTTDLDEAPTVGLSHVKYTFRNVNNPNDSLQFNLRYNDPTAGIKELNASVVRFEVYPNPAVNEVNIRINSPQAQISSVRVLNGLGQVVISKSVSVNAGSNTVQIDTKQLPTGNYYISYDSGEKMITKKVVITK